MKKIIPILLTLSLITTACSKEEKIQRHKSLAKKLKLLKVKRQAKKKSLILQQEILTATR
ncbi:hypothetical protein [Gemella sp. zg-1178]|uniref:hypothetical protein n=1 Tax=Gemella sp. zg-1178 TaxID=2840372 RepID=UPI00207B132E|nr:hypothetical protein [Gemella sp. zg-1178]